jgi:hypothetical protein
LFTYVFGLNVQNNLVLLGREITIPGSEIKLRLDSIKSDFFTGDRLAFFKRRALSQEIKLSLMGADGSVIQKTLAYNSPIWHRGYSIHLKKLLPQGQNIHAPASLCQSHNPLGSGGKNFFLWHHNFCGGAVGLSMASPAAAPSTRIPGGARMKKIGIIACMALAVWLMGALPVQAGFTAIGPYSVESRDDGSFIVTDGIGRKIYLLPRGTK